MHIGVFVYVSVLGPLKLTLQTIVNCYVGTGI